MNNWIKATFRVLGVIAICLAVIVATLYTASLYPQIAFIILVVIVIGSMIGGIITSEKRYLDDMDKLK